MSGLQAQAMQYMSCIPEMSEEELSKLIDFFRETISPSRIAAAVGQQASEKKTLKIGLFNGTKYIADGHDLDEFNDEIAALFGVEGE